MESLSTHDVDTMAPIIPTRRPLLTPMRLALGTALAAVMSSALAVMAAAPGEPALAPPSLNAVWDCADPHARTEPVELAARADHPAPPTP